MSKGYPSRRLADLMHLDIEREPMAGGTTYRLAGVLNAGQGLVGKGEIDGGDTEYAAMNVLREGQVVMRKLTAWEGPITVVPAEYDGFVVSGEFPTFTLGDDIAPEWFRLVCQSPRLWAEMKSRVVGTVQRRKRLNPDQLLAIEFPVPPASVQERIVDVIGAVDDHIAALDVEATTAEDLLTQIGIDRLGLPDAESVTAIDSLLSRSIGGVWGSDPGVDVIDVPVYRSTEFTNLGVLQTPAGAYRSVTAKQLAGRRLADGDILLEKSGGTPSRPVARVVRAAGVEANAIGANFLHLMRVDPSKADPDYIFWVLWTAHRRGDPFDYQQASTNIRNLKTPDYLARRIDLPERGRQTALGAAMDSIQDRMLTTSAEADRLRAVRGSLLSALLNRDIEIDAAEEAVS